MVGLRWPIDDGNERLAWLGTYVFCSKNDVELVPADDDAFDLVMAIASGELDDLDVIAANLKNFASTTDS